MQGILNAIVHDKGVVYEKAQQMIPFGDFVIEDQSESISLASIDFGDLQISFKFHWDKKEGVGYKLVSLD